MDTDEQWIQENTIHIEDYSPSIIDIETDGFLDVATRIHMVVIRRISDGVVTGAYFYGDLRWKNRLNKHERLVGHNVLGYDFLVFMKLHGVEITCPVHDTMLMSQTLDYKRFPSGRHRLEDWGDFLKEPKGDFDPAKFKDPSFEDLKEMFVYCCQDTQTNLKAYQHLLKEFQEKVAKKPLLKQSLRNEHDVARFVGTAELNGWLFDRIAGEALLEVLNNDINRIQKIIEPKLKLTVKLIDKEPVDTKWIKDGRYAVNTVKHFGIDQERGRTDRPIEGQYQRIEFVQPDITSMEAIKTHLYSIGWVPDDWNWKRVNGKPVKVSPKLTTSSLEVLGEDGLLVDELTTTRSRRDILRGWLENLDENDRLHGSCFTIATPTGRARHATIVNVPSGDAKTKWGKEIRSLFITRSGYKVVGADSSGNQFRALCHYLKNPAYTDIVLNGDIHQENANVLSAIVKAIVPRSIAKPFIYAYLFGAGNEKAALIVIGKRDAKVGKKLKAEFAEKVPGLKDLLDKIKAIYEKTAGADERRAWIPGADGRKIYCDSPHKALNYLLQSFEAISCKAAVAYFMKKMKEEKIPYDPLIFYHDEFEFECLEEYAERGREIAVEAFKEAGKVFGMMILDGAGKIGNNWYEVH
jgi:DNA polymerase-1